MKSTAKVKAIHWVGSECRSDGPQWKKMLQCHRKKGKDVHACMCVCINTEMKHRGGETKTYR